MTYLEAKRAVMEKVIVQRCWRALNPDLEPEIVSPMIGSIKDAASGYVSVLFPPRNRKAIIIREVLRSMPWQRVSVDGWDIPF